jgi:hypothetical protein
MFRIYYPLIAFQPLYALVLMRCGDEPREVVSGSSLHSKIAGFMSTITLPLDHTAIGRMGRRISTILPGFVVASLAVVAMTGVVVGNSHLYEWSQSRVSENRRLHEDIAGINPRNDELYVCFAGLGTRSFHLEAVLPLESPRNYRNLHLLFLGWIQQSPVNDAIKSHFQIDNLVSALLYKPNVYLIGDRLFHEKYGTFIREHHQTATQWEHCMNGCDFDVWKPIPTNTDEQLGAAPQADIRPSMASRWRQARQ